MAAQSLVIKSFKDPLETFHTNVMGTANVLENCRRLEKKCVAAVITTDKVYKNLENKRAFSEDDELQGNEPYSSSKVGSEEVVRAWRQLSTNTKILSLRAGNVIGGGDLSENRLLPDIVRQKFKQSQLQIRNLDATRPWQHVLDPLAGYLAAIEYALDNGDEDTFNFGPDYASLSVGHVLEISKRIWKGLSYSIDANDGLVHESQNLDLNSDLAKELLRWHPKMNQEDAIISTLKWWDLLYEQKMSPLEITLSQIREYMALNNEYRSG
jgi:CDP-glucose 4,6-dehydratase